MWNNLIEILQINWSGKPTSWFCNENKQIVTNRVISCFVAVSFLQKNI